MNQSWIAETKRVTYVAHAAGCVQEWIAETKCVVMDCDGPKHVIIHDLDGSLTGLGANASILSRADFMNERRADKTKYTWYNIPTKMLYDPAPLNDPGDPGHDMSAYANYSSGAQSFTYRRRTQSATEADWRNRMVFYTGDERNFYPGGTTRSCDPTSAILDPACRTSRRTHAEVAYRGYWTYREGCTLVTAWNAWRCTAASLTPARLLIESLDEDHLSRSLTPVALASGGYVDLMNAGWDHQKPKECGGYAW